MYKLKFGKSARKAWDALDVGVKRQFQKKLEKVLRDPHIPSMRLHGYQNAYRIKLRKAGMRLGYKVFDKELVVLVIAVGPRDKNEVYEDFAENYQKGLGGE